jgi:DNA-binding HxlR family transcriptional regulator
MEKGTPCILDQSNASRKTLSLIANEWAILVLFSLRNGKQRFAEMRQTIGGITEKMLIQTLRNLERDGLISRKVYPVVPPKVEYQISPLGHSLAPILDAIAAWSYGNLIKVHSARAAYEKKTAKKKISKGSPSNGRLRLTL